MRVTQKGQVTIPLEVVVLGIYAGSDVEFELDERRQESRRLGTTA